MKKKNTILRGMELSEFVNMYEYMRKLYTEPLTLGELINLLKELPAKTKVMNSMTEPHSYRGFYGDIAFTFVPTESTVGEQLKLAESVLNKEFTGYKGGTFKMTSNTVCWSAEHGCLGDELTFDLFSEKILKEERNCDCGCCN